MNETERLHTFQSDVAQNVENNHISTISIAAAEVKKHQGDEPRIQSEEPNHKKVIVVSFSVFLILLIGVGGYYFYTKHINKDSQTGVATTTPDSARELIVYEHEQEVDSSFFKKGVVAELGGIVHFKITQNVPDMLVHISPSVPSSLFRSFEPKGFFGSVNKDNFLIIKTDSYETAFAGMLEWEPAMKIDLLPLFQTEIGTSSAGWSFVDKIVSQKNIRELRDEKGNVAFAYGFYSPDIIVIAKKELILSAVFNMLNDQKVL